MEFTSDGNTYIKYADSKQAEMALGFQKNPMGVLMNVKSRSTLAVDAERSSCTFPSAA